MCVCRGHAGLGGRGTSSLGDCVNALNLMCCDRCDGEFVCVSVCVLLARNVILYRGAAKEGGGCDLPHVRRDLVPTTRLVLVLVLVTARFTPINKGTLAADP